MVTVTLDKTAGFDRVLLKIGGDDGWECVLTPLEAHALAADLTVIAAKCGPVVDPPPGPK